VIQAVAVSSAMEYAIVEQPGNDRLLVVGCDRLEPLKDLLGELKVLTTFGGESGLSRAGYTASSSDASPGDDLLGTSYDHLFWNSSQPKPKVIASRHVTSGAGTGLVHTAPGHGQEDYEAFRQSLGSDADTAEMRCPVDDLGNLTEEIASWAKGDGIASRLVGKSVLGDAVPAMVEILQDNGILLKQDAIHHRYPCDWKTKEPIIIRYVYLSGEVGNQLLTSAFTLGKIDHHHNGLRTLKRSDPPLFELSTGSISSLLNVRLRLYLGPLRKADGTAL
jgi:isoleucyl-tRNA synthetase